MLKMKFGALFIAILAVVVIFSLASFVVAKSEQSQQQNQGQNQEGTEVNDEEENGEDSTGRERGQANAEQHRSKVANFVQGLLNVADREQGGIGEQVRVIAQQQNQSASTTIQAMEKVEKRSKIKTFLIGSDYKNLGTLRSEIVHTRNRIEQLNRTIADIENEGDRTELQSQIQTLEQEQLRIESFIETEESKFSLFGWLIKLFNR